MKLVLCVPTITRPYQQLLQSIEDAVPALDAAGIEHQMVTEVGNPYISQARNVMLRKALDARADQVVFLDHDISFSPEALMTLIATEGDVVAGTYRFKKDEEEYMGRFVTDAAGRPVVRDSDGAVHAEWVPGGFLRVSASAVDQFMKAYPHLCYGVAYRPHVDLFNHGAHKGVWYGEDYAFSRNWNDCGGSIWLTPDIDITHHSADKAYPGNFHMYLRRRPGGDLCPSSTFDTTSTA
jgi:glycosyltransferase involved in cell wall biosynthesis